MHNAYPVLTWNPETGCYEGKTTDGRYFVRVDGDEIAETQQGVPEEELPGTLHPDAWFEQAGTNDRVHVEEVK